MRNGWAGVDLEIDLSQGKIEKKEGDAKLNEDYLAGKGTNTKMFWDRVAPEVDPFSPDNLLIFGTGVLTGTLAPSANRTVINTKSPQTDLQTYSSLGGFWGAELKFAGYDAVLVSGKSPTPVYLWINDDHVEIRDACHLWGKETRETEGTIRGELRNKKLQILSIGPAGENRVFGASIEHSSGVSASRSGIGAIMGDKNLKAIAVSGTKDVYIAQPSKFNELCKSILNKTDKIRAFLDDWSYAHAKLLMDEMTYGNLGEQMADENAGRLHAEFLKQFKARTAACFNCGIRCKFSIPLAGGVYSFVKCQSFFTFMYACKIRDFSFAVKCYNLCERYGLDSVSTANIVAFAIDLYEKGILTKEDTDGMRLEWGNEDVGFALVSKIARRDGIGDILANGVYKAARMIGKGAEDYAYHIKKLELTPFGIYTPYRALRTSITDRADMTRAEDGIVQFGLEASKEWKENYLKLDCFPYPKTFEKVFLDDFAGLTREYKKIVPFTSFDVDKNTLADCSGLCIFWTGFYLYNPINLSDHIKLISYGTGIDIDETQAIKIAKRIGTLFRAYNNLLGLRRKDDRIPGKFFRDPPPANFVQLEEGKYNKMIDEFYSLRGWNSEGIPTKETLQELNLDYVRRVFEQRGVL
jgi:aldehyde:ferredoxin oxidoreductase